MMPHAHRFICWLAGLAGAGRGATAASDEFPAPPHDQLPFSDPFVSAAKPLFGGSLPWNESGRVTWLPVTDRVRGGASTAHLDPINLGSRVQGAIGVQGSGGKPAVFQYQQGHQQDHQQDHQQQGACFWGTLDTSTLGGAGFASVQTDWEDKATSLDLEAYDGILLEIADVTAGSDDAKNFTFITKDEVPGRRDDGRRESGINFEFSFSLAPDSTSARRLGGAASDDASSAAPCESLGPNTSHLVRIPWDEMTATYRGRRVDNPKPLRTDQIRSFSFMMRSYFDQQRGDFQLVLRRMSAYKRRDFAVQDSDMPRRY